MLMNNSSVQRYGEAEAKLWDYYGAQPQEDFLDLERPRLRVRFQALGEGPALLFLHGSPSCGTIWAPLAAKLPDYRCILLDLPGFGLSAPVDYGSSDIQTFVTDVIESVLNALELDKISLVASSSGGAKAYWYAMARPQRVERIVQLGTPFLLEGSPINMFTRLLTIPHLNRFLLRLIPVNIKAMRNIYIQIGHGPAIEDGRIPACFLEWALQLMVETNTMASTLNLVEAGMNWRGIRPEVMIGQAELARITQPTQYIWSEGDPDGGASLARETASRTPNSELHLLPGNGHLPWLDGAEEVAGLIRDFLQPIHIPLIASTGVRRI
jgi:pimeloyl-ACP methyl ester carboxylesterase